MKNKAFVSLAITACLIVSANMHAAIIDNNFDSVDTGSYNGRIGDPFLAGGSSSNTLLGNSSGRDNSQDVTAGSGVNGTSAIVSVDPFVRSRSFADRTVQTNFSMYFKFEDSALAAYSDGFVGAGWGVTAGTDNNASFNGIPDGVRFMVGLGQTNNGTLTEVEFQYFSRFNAHANISGTPTMTLTDNEWYQLSFDLAFNATDQNFDVADLTLRNWGSNGITGGSVVGSVAFASDLALFGMTDTGNVGDPTADSYALFAGNQGRGAGTLDNLIVVPEPGTLVLVSISLGALLLFRHRR